MQFFLKPESGAEILFSVLDFTGRPVFEIAGEFNSIGCRCQLRDTDGKCIARIAGVRLPNGYHYAISSGKRRLWMTVDPAAFRRPVQFKGVRWRFRGNILTRSFDLLEDRGHKLRPPQLIMTHGRCWNSPDDCYALEIPRESDVSLAICSAAAIDSAILGGCAAPVPAG